MWLPLALIAVLLPAPAAPQGMASPDVVRRDAAPVETDLPPIEVDFRDVAVAAGMTAPNLSGGAEAKDYILETTGNGVVILDYDGDGRMDVFLPNGSTIGGAGADGSSGANRLYRNLGELRFEEVAAGAGVAGSGWAQGGCAGDYDADGDPDLFVTHFGHSRLYRNDAGRFTDVTGEAGAETGAVRWETGCSFVDYDLDGQLDLAVAAYLEFDPAEIPAPGSTSYCVWKGIPVMCGPRGLPFTRNRLLRNLGDGRFEDASETSGVGAAGGCYGLGLVASDLDGDAWPDLYVACDSTPSLLYHNRRDGTFEELGLLSGLALNESGQEQGGMGVAVGDYDGDGRLDVIKTNFADDVPNVYRNLGDLFFEDRVFESGLGSYMEHVGWGLNLLDVDHDGLTELVIVNGHVYPEVERNPGLHYRQPRLLYWNVGGGRFLEITAEAGPAFQGSWPGRGSAVADLDGDGSLEIVVNNLGERPGLLKNYGPRQNWLLVRCHGTRSHPDALGARVWLEAAGSRQVREVQGGTGYVSQSDPRLHFGLGAARSFDALEVRWPGGALERFPGGPGNRVVELREGEGAPADPPPGESHR